MTRTAVARVATQPQDQSPSSAKIHSIGDTNNRRLDDRMQEALSYMLPAGWNAPGRLQLQPNGDYIFSTSHHGCSADESTTPTSKPLMIDKETMSALIRNGCVTADLRPTLAGEGFESAMKCQQALVRRDQTQAA